MSENNISIDPAPSGSDLVRGDSSIPSGSDPTVVAVLPSPHKKFPLILLFLLPILVVVAVISLYVLLQARTMYQQTVVVASPTPSHTASADPTSTWTTYTNISGNYTIKYPSEWQITNIAAGSLENEPPSDARYIEIAPTKNNPTVASGNIGIEEVGMIPPSEEENLNQEKIIGNISLKCSEVSTDDSKAWCWIKVPGQDKYLNIQVFKGTNKDNNLLFDQILSTFKFTD